MAFIDFDSLMGKAKDLAQAGVNKSKQLGELAKLNLSIAGEEENIRKVYVEIGKLYYAEKGMAPDPGFADLCERITTSKVTIEETRSRIEALKAEGGVEEADMAPVVEEPIPEEPVLPTEDETPPQE